MSLKVTPAPYYNVQVASNYLWGMLPLQEANIFQSISSSYWQHEYMHMNLSALHICFLQSAAAIMGRLNPLLFFLVVGRFVNAELVARQWAQIPECGQGCVEAAPLGTCGDKDWNCLCRTDCSRTGLVNPTLRALEGLCGSNGVSVALTPSPQAPPRPPQTGVSTVAFPSSTAPNTTQPPTSASNASSESSTAPTNSTAPSSSNTGTTSNANSNGSEKGTSGSMTVIAAVASGAAVLIVALVVSYLIYIRRLKYSNGYANQTEVRPYAYATSTSIVEPLSPRRQATFNPNRRTSIHSSHAGTTYSRGEQPAVIHYPTVASRKGWTAPSIGNTAPVAPRDDNPNISSSDIVVHHHDSGVDVTPGPSSRSVAELPPEYRNSPR
ncbi:hypothetical protein BJ165DRAFT_1401052 [Panaeolus papilionaceus]|nr:hypothetical protein BJ165DRAFT_1401052 [Panaeolus papilionaceus]